MKTLTLVFVHGYSVSNLNTYGELPQRLQNEAESFGFFIQIENVYLGRFISFNDEVQLKDLAIAFQSAIQKQIPKASRFACITHSTGAPLVRTWLNLYFSNNEPCPLSHLIMLAPANHGSSLAQLGKSRLSRIKSWFDGIEPGQKVLNWLELGSDEAWHLNKSWIYTEAEKLIDNSVFPFVLCGQDIDRKLYDHLNSYTGEIGSDGVVRLASANLNSRYIILEQETPELKNESSFAPLSLIEVQDAPKNALCLLSKKSHSGNSMGILKSIRKETEDKNSEETVHGIFDCLSVTDRTNYFSLCESFIQRSNKIQIESLVEVNANILHKQKLIHDKHAMVIFKLIDFENNPITDFDLILTAGKDNDPNALSTGFLSDRQVNRINKSTLTYFFNYDKIIGAEEIVYEGEILREKIQGMDSLGIRVQARPEKGFIRYFSTEIKASKELRDLLLKPNATTLVEIKLHRLISSEVFQFEKLKINQETELDFKNTQPGQDYIV